MNHQGWKFLFALRRQPFTQLQLNLHFNNSNRKLLYFIRIHLCTYLIWQRLENIHSVYIDPDKHQTKFPNSVLYLIGQKRRSNGLHSLSLN